ncbi:hypothetical protein GGR95_000820 [Sulfitobacter undariae]|uniref:Uncharacterized protein n=1 Tax=Sulfitobacter undariae TaxID=1563671 RepID=A0A7W6E5U4_9RHOB|nr:hypothetical protein [Sulfitobacter undariae]MBB3993192.1 hypothetical protein [Sulfitobacter undariae]
MKNPTDFWETVLEPDEKLLWTGQPKPRLHWRNWRLYGPAPMAAAGLFLAGGFIIATQGKDNDVWLLLLPALLVLIPAWATWRQLKAFAATRYALTDKRALMFRIEGQKTRVKAIPRETITAPNLRNTMPASVTFLLPEAKKKTEIGFEFVEHTDALLPHLEARV